MSAFDFFEKDEVVESIKTLAKEEKNRGKETPEIVNSIMEAVNYGLTEVLWEERNR